MSLRIGWSCSPLLDSAALFGAESGSTGFLVLDGGVNVRLTERLRLAADIEAAPFIVASSDKGPVDAKWQYFAPVVSLGYVFGGTERKRSGYMFRMSPTPTCHMSCRTSMPVASADAAD